MGSTSTSAHDYAAAVAVLVKEYELKRAASRDPGLLWFNDQYVVEPSHGTRVTERDRYPCTGAVIAVNRGDMVDQDEEGRWTLANATYNESYYITDPNDHAWIVDQWFTTWGTPAWSVAILNNQLGYNVSDDGKRNCSTYSDRMCLAPDIPRDSFCTGGGDFYRRKSPGDNGMAYPGLAYNALLYMRLVHLDEAAEPKNHTERVGDDWWRDTTGCHEDARNRYRCPADANGTRDDDREGNSHPFNPDRPWPTVRYAGENNHGGSDSCDGVYESCHATRLIDIYYGYVDAPFFRRFTVNDVEGSEAPFHCHPDTPQGHCYDATYTFPAAGIDS